MTNMHLDWRDKLREMLLKAETEGLAQAKIIKALDDWVDTEEIQGYLEGLLAEGRVQRFTIQGRYGRPKTIWRATIYYDRATSDE
jgi:predicted ArsR family transcriptional regulator